MDSTRNNSGHGFLDDKSQVHMCTPANKCWDRTCIYSLDTHTAKGCEEEWLKDLPFSCNYQQNTTNTRLLNMYEWVEG